MRILVVEDDKNKREQLEKFLSDPSRANSLAIAKSFHSGLAAIMAERFDLIVLDMTMPTFDIGKKEDGGRPQHYAGRELLRQMDRRGISTPVVVVTQFDVFGEGSDMLTRDQLDAELRGSHLHNYLGTIFYNPTTGEWREELDRVTRAIEAERA